MKNKAAEVKFQNNWWLYKARERAREKEKESKEHLQTGLHKNEPSTLRKVVFHTL